MFNFKDFYLFNEAISLKDVRKKLLTRKYSGAYSIDILNKVFEGKDRLIYDIDINAGEVVTEVNPLITTIVDLIYKHFNVTIRERQDYIRGVAYDIKDNNKKQPKKIGRLLNKLASKGNNEAKRLLKAFNEDPIRSAKRQSDYKVVISRHPYDVAGMSTDRNWTSCMNLGTEGIHYKTKPSGQFNHHVKQDVNHGSIVAYLVEGSDRHPNGKIAIHRPLSRILMKPHLNHDNKNDYAYSKGRTYGAPVKEFSEFVEEWLLKNININTNGKVYYQIPGLYSDGDDTPNFTVDTISKSIASEIFYDKLSYHTDEKYFNLIEISPIDAQFYGGRSLEIKVSFNIPKGVKMDDFRYDHWEVKPDYIINIIKSIDLGNFDSYGSQNFHVHNIESFLDTNTLLVEFVFTDNYFEEDKYWNEDSERDYWEAVMDWLGVDNFNYQESLDKIIQILKDTDVELQKQNERKKLLDEFHRIQMLPETRKLELNATSFNWQKASDAVEYFGKVVKMNMFDINQIIDTYEFREKKHDLLYFIHNYKTLIHTYWSNLNFPENTLIDRREEYINLVKKRLIWDDFFSEFVEKSRRFEPIRLYDNRQENQYHEFISEYGSGRWNIIVNIFKELSNKIDEVSIYGKI